MQTLQSSCTRLLPCEATAWNPTGTYNTSLDLRHQVSESNVDVAPCCQIWEMAPAGKKGLRTKHEPPPSQLSKPTESLAVTIVSLKCTFMQCAWSLWRKCVMQPCSVVCQWNYAEWRATVSFAPRKVKHTGGHSRLSHSLASSVTCAYAYLKPSFLSHVLFAAPGVAVFEAELLGTIFNLLHLYQRGSPECIWSCDVGMKPNQIFSVHYSQSFIIQHEDRNVSHNRGLFAINVLV